MRDRRLFGESLYEAALRRDLARREHPSESFTPAPDPMEHLIGEVREFGPDAERAYAMSDEWTQAELHQLSQAITGTLSHLHLLKRQVETAIWSYPNPRQVDETDMPRIETDDEYRRGL